MVAQMEELVQRLINTPQARKVATEMETERLANRQKLADEIKEIQDKIGSEMPKRQAAVEKAQASVDVAFEALQTARQDLGQALGAASNRSASTRIDLLEATLKKSADVETIRAFTKEMDELHEQVRGGYYTRPHETEKDVEGRRRPKKDGDPGNVKEVSVSLGQIVEARREATKLALAPLDKADLEAKLSELRASIVLPK